MILAGDIGGTKTVLALFEVEGEDVREVRSTRYPSSDHGSLEEIVEQFLADDAEPDPEAACFGIAGAVIDGRVRATNLPWETSEASLGVASHAPRVKLLNDLEAMAYGMLYLQPEELATLNEGERETLRGNVAVIAAGTGLGEAMLYFDGETHHPIASEGGHADFAPQTDEEIELLRYLRRKFEGHVSWERILSGPGLSNVYGFLRDTGFAPESPTVAKQLAAADDPNVVITQVGLAHDDRLCEAALDHFANLYGAEAGNMALRCMATGGVFLGGGIAPKLLPALADGSFMFGFGNKGRFSNFLRGIDVYVSLNPRTPLLGAAHYARRLVV